MDDTVVDINEVHNENTTNKETFPLIKTYYYKRHSIDYRQQLLQAVLNGDEENIESILHNTKEDFRYEKYDDHNKKSILIIACINESVAISTLRTLLQSMITKYETKEFIDEHWYGWEPVHYVARTGNVEKLQVILEVLPESINSVTIFSENALHILLQYEKSLTCFPVILHSEEEPKQVTIIGPENETILKCAKLLVNEGIDVNQTNYWNETPICFAIRSRSSKLIEFMLTIDYIDIDSFTESGQTIREYLKWNLFTSLSKSSTSYIQEDRKRLRFNFLKSGNEESFLSYNLQSLGDCVNSVECENACTMLQFCLRKGFMEYVQDEQYKTRITNFDIKDNPMLTIFKEKGFKRCIKRLLDLGADTSKTTKKFKETLLEYSSLRGYYPFVAILLQHRNGKITEDNIFDVLSKIFRTQFDLRHQEFYRNCVLNLLLNKLLSILRRRKRNFNSKKSEEIPEQEMLMLSGKKRSILNKLLYNLNLECDDQKLNETELIYQILQLGGSLTYKESQNNSQMVVQRLDQTALKTHFDDCVYGTTFSYDSIIQDDNIVYNENRTIYFLVNDDHKKVLLTHPIFIEFIEKKWQKIKLVFQVDLLFYCLLLKSIYCYMLLQHFNYNVYIVNIFYYVFVSMHIVKECVQFFVLYRNKYLLDSTNRLEAVTIICCLITIFLPNIYSSVLSILFSTFLLFLLLGQLPSFSKYTVIFGSIRYFLEYMAFYSVQFLAFALSFYMVFPFSNNDTFANNINNTCPNEENCANFTVTSSDLNWGDIAKSMFLTLIYFTGEFGERVTEPTDYPVFGRILMTLFIFCMTIILNNLLVGLIVADMDVIQQVGRLDKQIKLARFIQSVNTFIKRIHDFKSYDIIKRYIYFVNVFHKNQRKDIKNVNMHNFDDENKEYLKNIKRAQIFDKHALKDIYYEIFNK